MPQRAKITSVEAIKEFRSHLIVYVTKARPTLDEVGGDVMRTRLWLQTEQRPFWEGQLLKRSRRLEEAKANLFSAKLSSFREATTAEQIAVTKAKRAVEEAEAKLKVIRQWDREFENRTEPLLKQMEKLHSVLAGDLPNAIAYLSQVLDTLAAYAGVTAPSAAPAAVPAGGGDSVGEMAKAEEPAAANAPGADAAKVAGEGKP
jgi:hypothetical protein